MTSLSIAVSCLAALCCGLVAGRCLRHFRGGIAVATAMACSVGTVLLQVSRSQDLLRIVQPRVALDWLPLVCLGAAATVWITSARFRVLSCVGLAVLAPIRMLWGSIHLQSVPASWEVALSLAVWSAALAIAMLLQDQSSARSTRWKLPFWIVATTVTALIITASGSVIYGMATAVCGLGILGVLLATMQIHNIAAVPMICLIGLSASFAELPVMTAGMLFLMWCGTLVSERVSDHRIAALVRVSTAVVLLISGSMTYVRLTHDSERSDKWVLGYGSLDNDATMSRQNNHVSAVPLIGEKGQKDLPPINEKRSASPVGSSDPLDGFQ